MPLALFLMIQKLLIILVAVVLVAPPLTSILDDGDSSHAHADHIWHQVGAEDLTHNHNSDQQDSNHCDIHMSCVHIATMALFNANSSFLLPVILANPHFSTSTVSGRDVSPPRRPPRTNV